MDIGSDPLQGFKAAYLRSSEMGSLHTPPIRLLLSPLCSLWEWFGSLIGD